MRYRSYVQHTDKPGVVAVDANIEGEIITAYNGTGGEIAQGTPFVLQYDETEDQEVQVLDATGAMAFGVTVVIAQETIADEAIGKFALNGKAVEALVEETGSISAGNFLEYAADTSALVDNGTSRTANTCAVLVDAVTAGENDGSPVLKTVVLLDEPAQIAAS